MDTAYKVVLLVWAKDLAETAIIATIAWPVMRRLVKKYIGDLTCPHCGKNYTQTTTGERGTAVQQAEGERKAEGVMNSAVR